MFDACAVSNSSMPDAAPAGSSAEQSSDPLQAGTHPALPAQPNVQDGSPESPGTAGSRAPRVRDSLLVVGVASAIAGLIAGAGLIALCDETGEAPGERSHQHREAPPADGRWERPSRSETNDIS